MIQLINYHNDITVDSYKSEKQNLKRRRRRSLAYLPESSSELTSSKRRDLPSKSVKSSIRRSNLRLEKKPAIVTLTFIMALTLIVFSVASVATVWVGEVWTLGGRKMKRLLLFGQCIGFGSELSEGHIGREVVPWEPWMKGLCRKRRLRLVCCEHR